MSVIKTIIGFIVCILMAIGVGCIAWSFCINSREIGIIGIILLFITIPLYCYFLATDGQNIEYSWLSQ